MSITIDIHLEDADLRLLHEAMTTDPYVIESLRERLWEQNDPDAPLEPDMESDEATWDAFYAAETEAEEAFDERVQRIADAVKAALTTSLADALDIDEGPTNPGVSVVTLPPLDTSVSQVIL